MEKCWTFVIRMILLLVGSLNSERPRWFCAEQLVTECRLSDVPTPVLKWKTRKDNPSDYC